ncbi:MAG: FkbM family methyltransferase [Gaiellaceae bacterium]
MRLGRSLKRPLKRAVWATVNRCGFRLVRTPPGSPSKPGDFLQPGFDFVLGHYLLSRDASRPFFFVQIGAFDGVTDDPLHEYVRRFGWSGVLLEPQRRYFEALRDNYRDCQGLLLLRAALDRTSGTRTLYTIGDPEATGHPEWAGAVASFTREMLLKHRDLPDVADLIVAEPVETISFDELLVRAGTDRIDLIQVDAEGYDAEILRMIDFHRVMPAIVRFEHRLLSRKEHAGAIRLLTSVGYRILPEQFDTCAYLEPLTASEALVG